jgi:mannitol/fructose-specific phosphotransferase system IIA component (Ntr-type)
MQVRGTMSLRRLDDLLDEDVHLLKVDVEGWEEAVLQGAARLLAQKRVKYIITEANSQLRSRASLLAFMRWVCSWLLLG